MLLPSFVLATSLLLSLVHTPVLAHWGGGGRDDSPSCSTGEIRLWTFLGDRARSINFSDNQRQALKGHAKKACICEGVDGDEISGAFILPLLLLLLLSLYASFLLRSQLALRERGKKRRSLWNEKS